MRTHSSSNLIAEYSTTLKRRNRRHSKQRFEPFSLEESPVVTMADQCTMAELLQAPTERYEDAIVISAILAENFKLKHGLLNLVTSKQFYGFEKEDPHAHIRWFNKITSTIKYRDVPNSSIKLMFFPFSIEGATRIWLEKEPPRSILTWEDLVSKFINQFFPPSKTTNLRNEITNFQQRFDESFCEAWDRFKDLLRACLSMILRSINLMPLSIWKKLSLPELTPTQCSTSGNPTSSYRSIFLSLFSSLTPFGEETSFGEIEACLTNDLIPSGIDDDNFDPKGDLLILEKLLNDDPSSPLPPKELHVEELKIVKSSIDDPPELELKDLPSHLEYAFLEGTDKLPVIIAKDLKEDEKGTDPQFCTHKILMEDDSKLAIQHQRRVNPKIHKVIKKQVIKLIDAGLIYPIFDSPWVSPVHCVPKKGGITVIENDDNELIPTQLVTGWRVCIDYRKLNDATRKDHFPLPFMDQMLKRLAGNDYYGFLDGFSRYFQIPIDLQDQEMTTFTCPYGTFAYRRMPFGLCNAPGTFQRCMMAIFHDMIEETMEVFMDDFSVFGDSFSSCLSHLDKMLKRYEDTNLVLN
ncbi:reverse transcriptase domain-containing protein [Tanacetum coccineum]